MKFEDFSWRLMVNEYGTDEIEMVLDSMDPVWKMVLILHHEEALSILAVARLMRYRKVDTVRNFYHDGMRKLYNYFHPKDTLPEYWGAPFNRKLLLSKNVERVAYWEWLIYRHPGSRIQRALESMKFDNRLVILLHHGENKNFEEVGELLHYSAHTIKMIYLRSFSFLLSWFREHYPMQDRRLLKVYFEILIADI